MPTPYINTSFLHGFGSLVLSKGGDLKMLCLSVGLSTDMLEQDNQLIPFEQFIHLLETTADLLHFPDVSMALAKQQDTMILAPLNPMLRQCTTVSDVLNVVLKYLRILVFGYQVEVTERSGYLSFEFKLDLPHIQGRVQYQDYAMASAVNILHGLLGSTYPIRACYFQRPEQNKDRIAEYARYYGCPVAFNCSTLSLSIDSSITRVETVTLVNQINDRVISAQQRTHDDFVRQVSRVISFSLANGLSGINDVATSMNHSKRTLQRKLADQNTSYSLLLESVRFSMANGYLKNTHYSLSDIAALLGYKNLSAFSRSYGRWSGNKPSDVRRVVTGFVRNDEVN